MAGEAETKLYVAATQGDVATFQDVLQQSPHLLDGAPYAYSRNLLHIATMWEQEGIVDEVLKRNPKLAVDLDSQNSSPLHIAAANGNLQISSKLLAEAPKMCWSLDCQGMNPIHIAAMNGNVEVFEQLLQFNPSPAMERLNRGQTILHLCVKHGQLTMLQILLEKFGDLVQVKDDDGETLLHSAVRCNELEIVRDLIRRKSIMAATSNSMQYTPLGILGEMPSNDATLEIRNILWKEVKGKYLLSLDPNSRVRDGIMVVVALVATVAFQSILYPPGGVWQEDSTTHKAGEAVMASTRPKIYKAFVLCNTLAFIASLIGMVTIIPLSVSLAQTSSKVAVNAFAMGLVCVAVSYGTSLTVILPTSGTQGFHPYTYVYWAIVISLPFISPAVDIIKALVFSISTIIVYVFNKLGLDQCFARVAG